MNPQEISIPVPWGHIAAKAYGDNTRPAVLCVHGIQDNCDTFVTLLPSLPDDYYYVCVDLPGHGGSDHFPAYVPLEFTNYLAAIKWVMDHFAWSEVAYLGHSFGGQLGSWLAGVYPERVRCLIVLDTMGPRSVDMGDTLTAVRGRIDDAQSLHRRQCGRKPPSYTFGEAVGKMMAGRPSKLTDESARILAGRALARVDGDDDKYTFASDQRLKLAFYPLMTFDQQKQILGSIACPVVFVLADENCGRYSTYLKDAYEFYSKRPNVTIRVVSGDHDVHLNYPDRVFKHVADFLQEHYKTKLWVGQQKKSDGRGERVMCLHGYQDNCASFDHLIPVLDGDRTYLCFDWPNHGGSSGTPLGVRWTVENYALAIRRVADHVQWLSPFACLGHSMGGQVAKLFAALYPERVTRLVLLDTAGPVAMYPEEITWSARRANDELLRFETRMTASTGGAGRPPPVYAYPEALDRVRRRAYGPLDDGPARTLMTRYLRPGPAGEFRLANDVRLGVPYSQWFSAAQHWDVVTNIRCPTLLIRASDSDSYYNDVYGVFVEMYGRNPNFRTVTVDGNHDVHMNNPSAVAILINKFLNNKLSKL